MDYRIESDSIGEKQVPKEVYYGVQSLRGCENFKITGRKMHTEFIKSLAAVKKASAVTNYESGVLDKDKANAIVEACNEILDRKSTRLNSSHANISYAVFCL